MSLSRVYWAWRASLPPAEKLVLLHVANSGDGWHHAKVGSIAGFAGIAVDAVEGCLEYLAEAGFIERRDRATLNLVRLNFTEDMVTLVVPMDAELLVRARPMFVYFIRSRGLIKIGMSGDPKTRIKALRTTWPDPIEVLKIISGGKKLEAQYHAKFSRLREIGEWFRESEELLTFIEKLEAAEVPG